MRVPRIIFEYFSPQAEYPNLTHLFNAKVHFVSVANISPLADVQSMWTAMAKVRPCDCSH